MDQLPIDFAAPERRERAERPVRHQYEEMARQLAEQGMARTLDAEPDGWIDSALAALKRFCAIPCYYEFKIEDFRAWYVTNGGSSPHDSHCWGAITGKACKAGLIAFTGKYAPSVSPKTHGHPVKVWRPSS